MNTKANRDGLVWRVAESEGVPSSARKPMAFGEDVGRDEIPAGPAS